MMEDYFLKKPIRKMCFSPYFHLLVDPYGNVSFCWGPEKIIGNILNENFFEKWNSSFYYELRRSVIQNHMDQCKSCGFSHVRKSGIEYFIISSLLRFRSRLIEPRKLSAKNAIT